MYMLWKEKASEWLKAQECFFIQLRDASWQNIEPRALEIGDNQIFRLIQGQDLFKREAQDHAFCENQFKLNYLKYQKSKEKASE